MIVTIVNFLKTKRPLNTRKWQASNANPEGAVRLAVHVPLKKRERAAEGLGSRNRVCLVGEKV